MKSITINISSADITIRPNPIIIKRWLIDNNRAHVNDECTPSGPGWSVNWFIDSNQLFWTITFYSDKSFYFY